MVPRKARARFWEQRFALGRQCVVVEVEEDRLDLFRASPRQEHHGSAVLGAGARMRRVVVIEAVGRPVHAQEFKGKSPNSDCVRILLHWKWDHSTIGIASRRPAVYKCPPRKVEGVVRRLCDSIAAFVSCPKRGESGTTFWCLAIRVFSSSTQNSRVKALQPTRSAIRTMQGSTVPPLAAAVVDR